MNNSWKSILLPYTRNELPGWGKVLNTLGHTQRRYDHLWVGTPAKIIIGKEHGFLMELDMSDWAARITYFIGRYYELNILRLLDTMLSSGDRFIDIGANIGMIALHAAHLVGSEGSVECFEPNPRCREQLQRMIDLNSIGQIQIHPYGLSDEEEVLELKQNHSHTGIGTFADLDPTEVVCHTSAEVRRGDDVFSSDERLKPKLIKIDVEGFEFRAMKGMEQTLRRWECPVIMEMNERHLARAGTSLGSVYKFMLSLNYKPHIIGLSRRLMRHNLKLTSVDKVDELAGSHDILWSIA